MSDDQGFIDLRLNRQDSQAGESFWPSFTDIMTVVVMIFVIAMVVLLMRNMELVSQLRNTADQLRATMEAERVAAELARATGEEKESIALKLLRTEEQLASMQLRLLKLKEQRTAQENTIGKQTTQITSLSELRDRLQRLLQQLRQEAASRQTRLEASETALKSTRTDLTGAQARIANLAQTLADLERNMASLKDRFQSSQTDVAKLQETLADERRTAEAQRQLQAAEAKRYTVLVGEYDDLKVRYDKLVKPARSLKGRHLVEVRYWKQAGKYHIAWRDGGTGAYKEVARATLEKQLTALSKRHRNGLYVKVIFPEKSGLSYNEAWTFTSALHRGYDYYFKDNPASPKTPTGAARPSPKARTPAKQ